MDTLFDLPATGSSTESATTSANPRQGHSRWLLDHLIAGGHLTETGLGRAARIRTCSCGAPTLSGLDADICALEAHADPDPLTPLGEALAHVEGRRTWALDIRDHTHINRPPRRHQATRRRPPPTPLPHRTTHRRPHRTLPVPRDHPAPAAQQPAAVLRSPT